MNNILVFLKVFLLFKIHCCQSHVRKAPSSTESIMSHLSFCCDNVFKEYSLQMNWNKKQFSMKAFFLVNTFNLLLNYIHMYSSNWRNVVGAIQYLFEGVGEAVHLMRWSQRSQPQLVPACVRAILTTTETCSSPAEVLGIARLSATSSSQYRPTFAVLYHVALPHRMVQVSWCRLHSVKRLRSVSSSCSEKSCL